MTIDIDAIHTIVDDFNAEHSPGSWVRYWTGTGDDAPKYGQTRSKAELLGGHTPVVWVTTHGACIALTHVDVIPDQPDDIEYDTGDLPDPVRAAQRVMEYISAFGDGIYDVTTEGHPLYARDIESLRQAAIKVADLPACADEIEKLRAELAKARESYELAHADRLARSLERDQTVDEREYLKGEVARLTAERDFARDMANTARREAADAIRALDHARSVVEAAQALTETVPASLTTYFGARGEALVAAVDALPNDQEPCDTCSSTAGGCAECQPIDPQGTGWTQGEVDASQCQYGYPQAGGSVEWCQLRAGHTGLHKGDDHPIGFTDAGTVKRTTAVAR